MLVTCRIDDESLAVIDARAAELRVPRSFLIRAGALLVAQHPELLLRPDPVTLAEGAGGSAPPPPPPRKQRRNRRR